MRKTGKERIYKQEVMLANLFSGKKPYAGMIFLTRVLSLI
jgi:hypothetical protein